MPLRRQVLAIIAATVLVWAAVSLVQGETIDVTFFAPFGAVVTIVTLLAFGFVRSAWRWSVFRGWLVERPDLSGTWKCTLRSSFVDPGTGQPVQKTTYAVIRQTLTTLSMRLYTDTARSSSIADNLYLDRTDGLFTLVVAYQSVPKVEQRDVRSQIHYGCVLYDHFDYTSETLEGQYWTDRGTSGSVTLADRHPKPVSSFDEAMALFSR